MAWELHTQGCCPCEGQRGQLDEASRNPPSLHGQHHPGLCIPASGRSSLHRAAINAQPYSTAAASHQHPWSRWLQEVAPLGTRRGCSHPCSTISADHCFVQLIFVIFTSVQRRSFLRHFPYNLCKDWIFVWKSILSVSWHVDHVPSCGSLQEL